MQSRSRFMPPTSSMTDLSLDGPNGMKHSDSSNGFISLQAGDQHRRQGSSLIARQIEQENQMMRHYNAEQRTSEKNLQIVGEQKMNQLLHMANSQDHQVEQQHKDMKKQAMRDNIEESLRLRETTDTILAANLIKKEAQMNKNMFQKRGKQQQQPVNVDSIIGKLE